MKQTINRRVFLKGEERTMKMAIAWRLAFACLLMSCLLVSCMTQPEDSAKKLFKAGAYAMDVTPTGFPVIVNGNFFPATVTTVHDPLHVRWLVLDDGAERVALGILDTCMIPVEFVDAVKKRAHEVTGIPAERIMLSATHTHSAPSIMQTLGVPPDTRYPDFALPLIVEGLRRAVDALTPAQVGWASAKAPEHTHTRVWARRPDKKEIDPFGGFTVRAHMHPGYQNAVAVGPTGPSDPELSLLAIRSPEGRPLAVLTSYAMHYFGGVRSISADYYGVFAEKLGERLGATNGAPAFVGMMAQGTSGDQHWMDYSQPGRQVSREVYAAELAKIAADAYARADFRDWARLDMRQQSLRIATRQPDAARLEWARDVVAKMAGRSPRSYAEVYAREQLWLAEHPFRDVPLQAVRVGDLGIAVWPCEVFALQGLQVKAQSPFPLTMNIELANAAEGYIMAPELFPLGGYNTWACRTASLEQEASPKIVEVLTGLLEEVSGVRRQRVTVSHGPNARAVLDARPLAYWRLEEWGGPTAAEASGRGPAANYETGIARWLDGPASDAFSGPGAINRCVHLAGGRVTAEVKALGANYTAEFWYWSGVPNDWRGVTGVLFSRGSDVLSLEGTKGVPGRLSFGARTGRSAITPRTWNHVALVREGTRVRVYLNGAEEPELMGETAPVATGQLYFGGAKGAHETLEGKIDEIAVFGRALTGEEIAGRVLQARQQRF